MSGIDPRTPCIIGVAQRTWRQPGAAPEPLTMWAEVARAAADDAGARAGGSALLAGLDSVQVVYCQSWPYDDPSARLAGELSAAPGHLRYSGIGGTTPQQLVGTTAGAIQAGDLSLALIAGGEALATVRQIKKAGDRPTWSFRDPVKRPFPFEAPFIDTEIAHEVFQAWLTFALFDIGRRAHLGIAPAAYREALGALLAPLTEVAASNPHAWFPRARTARELATPSADNRMVGYPYTKEMVAVMDVDMAAALVLASHEQADALGVAADRRVYLRGWAYATDPVYVAEHHDFSSSPAMRAAASEVLRLARTDIDRIAHLDLYSCFAASLGYAQDALGLSPDDPRPLTVTGGLPYAGGPGSNYLTHSIAAMVERLRADPGSTGLVSGVGMHMTKHVWAAYSTEPPEAGLSAPDPGLQTRVDEIRSRPITDVASGDATIATYSVVHGRDGAPEWALLVCDLPDGSRCYARATDLDLLVDLEVDEWVGRSVHLTPTEAKVNLATPVT